MQTSACDPIYIQNTTVSTGTVVASVGIDAELRTVVPTEQALIVICRGGGEGGREGGMHYEVY